jgi:hypothetical protein
MGGAVSDLVSSVGDIGQGAIDIVSDAGASIDDTVNEVVPGGWTTVGLLAAGYYYAPEIGAYINASGSTVPVSAVVDAGATEAALTATDLAVGGGSLAGTAPTVGAGAGAATVGGYVSDAEQIAAMNTGAAATDMSLGQAGAANAAANATSTSIPTTTTGGISSGGNMNLSDFSSALNIASSVNSLTGGGVSSLLGGPGSISGSEAQQMADPFAPYRANLGQMYSGALQPGAGIDITKMPGYSQYTTGVLNPAMEASKRSAAASGLLYSGRESAALQDIGQRGYYGFMTDYLNRLAQGSGAVSNPAQAGGLGISQNMANQAAFSQGLGGLGQGIAGLYPGSSTNTMGNVPYNPSSIYSSFASPTSQYGYGVGSLLSGTGSIAD